MRQKLVYDNNTIRTFFNGKSEKEKLLMALNYRKCAEEIAANIGGGSNIISAAHCATRLRLVIADNSKVNITNTLAYVESYTENTSAQDLESILFQERRRELMFEGKRWYDLVRMARRDGNQDRLIGFVEKKYDASVLGAVKIKLKNPYAMYFPMDKDEVRNSQNVLKQNPAYKDDEKIEQASH